MNINRLFKSFQDKKVLIIGDVMIDSYIWGEVKRISPEAPVPIVNTKREEKRLGGAANVARNIYGLGAQPILCSIIGEDNNAEVLKSILEKEKISTQAIIKSKERITTVKKRILSDSQHILRIDTEMDTPISEKYTHLLLEKIKKLVAHVFVVIFQDYDKGVLNDFLIQEIIKMAKVKRIPTVVDPKKRNFFSYSGCSLFKPNLKELLEGVNINFQATNLAALHQAVKKLTQQMPIEKVMITLSEYGIYVTDLQSERHLPAHRREIADVSGAGDTVVSIAALCLAAGLPIETVASIANLGGGLVCQYAGVVPINKEELLQEATKHSTD